MAVFLTEKKYVEQRVCRFFAMGKCFSGDKCKFWHRHELMTKKASWICIHYVNNSCISGSNCRYAHVKWTKGLTLLPRICAKYLMDEDQVVYDKCSQPSCSYYHFKSAEFDLYTKDGILPKRYDKGIGNFVNRLVQYSSDEETHDDDDRSSRRRSGSRSRGPSRSNDKGRSKSKEHHSWSNDGESQKQHHRDFRRNRSRSPIHSIRGHPQQNQLPFYKQKSTSNNLKDLRKELDELWKDNKQLQQELDDHKQFHNKDQELITDLLRTRNNLEEDIERLNNEKEQLVKKVNDLFSDNKVVVEENQRLRGLLQEVQSLQEAQSRLAATPSITPTIMAPSHYQGTLRPNSHNSSSAYQQSSWN